MKVFEFDPTTGKRGRVIGHLDGPVDMTNRSRISCKLPRASRTEAWNVVDRITRHRREVQFDRPVCFCSGQYFAGTADKTGEWWWHVYLPPGHGQVVSRPCPACNGTGRSANHTRPCSLCGGSRYINS